ncbi:hypothetical protein AAVH_36955, partial [Aphelenchoides avenae]
EADNHDDSVYFNVDKHPNYHFDAIDNQHDYYYTEAVSYYNYGYYYVDVDEYTDEYRHYDDIVHAELNHNDCGVDKVVHKVDMGYSL